MDERVLSGLLFFVGVKFCGYIYRERDIYDQFCLSVPPSCMAKTLALDITQKLCSQTFSHLPLLRAPLTFTICNTVSGLNLGWGSKVQQKEQLFASFSGTPLK